MIGSIKALARTITPSGTQPSTRALPIEAPIAIEYNGIGYAVMMATPADLEDFALGFSLSERIVSSASEIEAVEPRDTPNGWLLKIQIAQIAVAPMVERVRVRVSESSCGLCGLENLEQVNRPLPPITTYLDVAPTAIFAA